MVKVILNALGLLVCLGASVWANHNKNLYANLTLQLIGLGFALGTMYQMATLTNKRGDHK